jgi:hypothetical protein
MKVIDWVLPRSFGTSQVWRIPALVLGLGWLALLPGRATADTDLLQPGQITIRPSSGPATLTLQGPAFDSAPAADYGLILSYHDRTSTDPTASAVFSLLRPNGQYQWHLSKEDGTERLVMQLDNDHALTLCDPNNGNESIVLQPGMGIFIDGQPVATMSAALLSPARLIVGPYASLSNQDDEGPPPPRGLLAVSGAAWGMNSIAIGQSSQAYGENAAALGEGAYAQGNGSIALGGHAVGTHSMGFGSGSYAYGLYSIAVWK